MAPSGLPIDPKKFYTFCGEIREKFYAIAPWVTMWPALHKVSTVVGFLIYFSGLDRIKKRVVNFELNGII